MNPSPEKKSLSLHYNNIRKNQKITKNSYLFVNDKLHIRHERDMNIKNKKENKHKEEVYIENVFNYQNEKTKFIKEDQQYLLNNEYDYMIT